MFRTELNITPSKDKITLSTPILTIGSCFSDNIGEKLEENKFQVLSNPFGTVYNPISIFKLLNTAVSQNLPEADSYLTNDGLHANYDFHSSFSSLHQGDLEESIEESISKTHQFLKSAKVIIITFGTAFVYRRIDNNTIVANCHKVPAKEFNKELLSHEAICNQFKVTYMQLKAFNPDLRFMLTVSPVRHIKDTLELNSVSKSALRTACHSLQEEYDDITYFPSYEIQLDDLRDYRFYKSDMLHPTEEATDYIWNKFAECNFDKNTIEFINEWAKIKRAIDHKPFNPNSDKHQKFLKNTLQKIKGLPSEVDFSSEVDLLETQILNSD
ncbi:GSCFA domain-containing protein [Fulvivirga lutea]|uniref:GSCFA domain-containing protein n=1 Tax=Fulvivirga lutea TaxID=2810512 RepID=A0A974WEQ4_9BACT|nr:GSCFA domain-containing protein [Fulvivirga lutea]QSE97034.1 GSCFA domain-containing protein [Fulvivirga lutea]